MCTVTLIPTASFDKGFVLTSNRDEAAGREAIEPQFYIENGVKMLFPKDKEAGGTWIGISERKRLICLLNGEFENHVKNGYYRLSRGVVVKELLAAENIDEAISRYDLDQIEPFTIILVDWKEQLRFVELVWDAKQKHIKELELKSHIWSSSPLYTKEMKKQRAQWFSEFQKKNKLFPENLLGFHELAGIGDKHIDLVMDRGFVKTQSITQIVNFPKETKMAYKDLRKNKTSETIFKMK